MRIRLGMVFCALLFALAACGREDPAPPAKADAPAAASAPAPAARPAPAATNSASRGVLDAWLAGWNAHDSAALGMLMTDDVEYFDAGFSGVQKGRDAALERGVWVFMNGVPDLHWELRGDPIVGADSVAWEWTFTGTHTGTWGGVRATRQNVQLKGVSVMRLRGGKVASIATYYDSMALNRQLGL